jgi:hypothetical protein
VVVERFIYGQKKEQISREFVSSWEAKVSERLAERSDGTFPANPKPDEKKATRGKKPCEYCQMQALCCFYDDPERALAQSEEEGDE